MSPILSGKVTLTRAHYLRSLFGGVYMGGAFACAPRARAAAFVAWGATLLWEYRPWRPIDGSIRSEEGR